MSIAPIRIDTSQMKKLVSNLKKATNAKTADAILMKVAQRVAAAMEGRVSPYPAQERRELPAIYTLTNAKGQTYQSKFKSEKQRRYFFAALKRNEITVPYRRGRGKSEQLGASITTRITKKGAVYRIEIGTDVSYAVYVIGEPAEQAPIHAGVWTPLSEDVLSQAAITEYQTVASQTLQAGLNAIAKGYTL